MTIWFSIILNFQCYRILALLDPCLRIQMPKCGTMDSLICLTNSILKLEHVGVPLWGSGVKDLALSLLWPGPWSNHLQWAWPPKLHNELGFEVCPKSSDFRPSREKIAYPHGVPPLAVFTAVLRDPSPSFTAAWYPVWACATPYVVSSFTNNWSCVYGIFYFCPYIFRIGSWKWDCWIQR